MIEDPHNDTILHNSEFSPKREPGIAVHINSSF